MRDLDGHPRFGRVTSRSIAARLLEVALAFCRSRRRWRYSLLDNRPLHHPKALDQRAISLLPLLPPFAADSRSRDFATLVGDSMFVLGLVLLVVGLILGISFLADASRGHRLGHGERDDDDLA